MTLNHLFFLLKKTLVVIALMPLISFGQKYFVGGSGASDDNSGTSEKPFKTIQKAAAVSVEGSVITIRPGTYRETVVPRSGTTWLADGIVVINGTNKVDSEWVVHSGNIYKTNINLPVNGSNTITRSNTIMLANQLFKDGTMMFEARWPDISNEEDLLDRTKVRAIPSTSTSITDSTNPSLTSTSITDSAIPPDVVGATVWLNGWYQSVTGIVAGQSGTTITIHHPQEDPKKRVFYYLTGKLSLLTQEKEWHYQDGILYLWNHGVPKDVEYKARNYGFDVTGKSNVTIRGIHFFGCDPVVASTSSNNIVVDGIVAKYMNHAVVHSKRDVIYANAIQTGIKLIGPNNVIRNSELQYAASQCIWIGENGVVENNLISNIGYDGNFGAGVTPWDNTGGQVIKYNTIYRTGRSSIDFGYNRYPTAMHHNVEIAFNDLYHFGMLNLDVGAIYAARGVNLEGTRVHHNWIHDSKVYLGNGIQTGIYWDQGAGPTTCDHNVLWNNVQTDVFTHPNSSISNRPVNHGPSFYYNNVFATKRTSTSNGYSYKSSNETPIDVQRNNIYCEGIIVALDKATPDVAHSILKTQDPQFNGTGKSGLKFRVKSTSPCVNRGIAIPGITIESVGVPDIGAYEVGGTDWVPGYKKKTDSSKK